nr:condensation domain-containing protein [Kutzneria buriramensis]
MVLAPRSVFEHQAVETLAKVAGSAWGTVVGDPVNQLPLTPVMHWLFARDGSFNHLSQSVLLTVPKGVDVLHITTAIDTLLGRHDMLRAQLESGTLRVRPLGAIRASDVLQRCIANSGLCEAVATQSRIAVAALNPAAGVMMRATWFDRGVDRSSRLLLTLHQLVVDGASWRILMADLALMWAGRSLRPVGTSFQTWARSLPARARSTAGLNRWLEVGAGAGGRLDCRPLDPTLDIMATMRSLNATLPPEQTGRLIETAPAASGSQITDVLLTALVRAIGQDHLLVDVETHGRDELDPEMDLTRTVGWFTAVHPVRLRLGGHHVHGGDPVDYGLLRWLNPDTGPTLAALPSAQITFSYLGRITAPGDGDWTLAPESAVVASGMDMRLACTHVLDVTVIVRDSADGPEVNATWTWPSRLLSQGRVESLVGCWLRELGLLARDARAR